MRFSIFIRSKSTRDAGMASGITATSCILTRQHDTYGITTGADTRGTTQNSVFLCGSGTHSCVQVEAISSAWPKLTRETPVRLMSIQSDQWLGLARVTM